MSQTEIVLTQGLKALIDSADLPLVNSRRWYAVKLRHSYYAVSSTYPEISCYLKMHRIIMGVTNPKIHVDHINGNGLDNRRSNLRLATPQQNNMNARKLKGLWPYKGVAYDPRNEKWYSRIRHNNKLNHLGTFETAEEAALAYNEKAIILFGEFASLNKLEDIEPKPGEVPPEHLSYI